MLMMAGTEEPIMRGTILGGLLFAAAATLGGCYASGDVGYRANYSSGPAYNGDAYVASPDLVTVSPGVQVVADYDEPVFYTDGFYWRYYNNGWYRSNNYAAGWNYYDRPPVAVLRIDRPYAYAHYRPAGYVARGNRRAYRPAEPINRGSRANVSRPEPVSRDRNTGSRGYVQPAPARTVQPAPARARPATAPAREHRDATVREHR
jgi:hypothetical protein